MRVGRTSAETAATTAMLHRAAWVIPVASPPVEDGAVLTDGDTILQVGSYRELRAGASTQARETDHGAAALVPALVNAHSHLELSALRGSIDLPQKGFPSWVRELFTSRAALDEEHSCAETAAGVAAMMDSGTGLVGDIGHSHELLNGSRAALPERYSFLEVLGFDRLRWQTTIEPPLLEGFLQACEERRTLSMAAHACYSASAPVIQSVKAWCRERGRVFSMHVAEPPEEIEFLDRGTGFFRELLEGLGKWVRGWQPPGLTPVAYLDHLGVLDSHSLLVHVVHLTPEDWETVATRGSAVCFCPRSNRNLNVGQPEISQACRHRIVAGLGTDSLASNTDLDVFAEGRYVLDHYPAVSASQVLHMATLGGARALWQDHRWGSLGPGKSSRFLAIQIPTGVSSRELHEAVVYQGAQGARSWASQPRD